MKTEKNNFSIGIFLIILGILIPIIMSVKNGPSQIFWFCYLALILIGIGILKKNDFLILSQLNIIMIPNIMWVVDFFYHLITGGPLFGIANYFFVTDYNYFKLLSFQHIFTPPLVLYSLYKIKIRKFSKKAWIASFLQIAIIYLLTKTITFPEENINCIFQSCVNFIPTTEYYEIIWIISFFFMAIFTNLFLKNVRALNK